MRPFTKMKANELHFREVLFDFEDEILKSDLSNESYTTYPAFDVPMQGVQNLLALWSAALSRL